MSTPAKPRPRSARPTVRATVVVAVANTTAPSTAESMSAGTTRRGPQRSSALPSGSCATAMAPKKTLVMSPSSAASRANSARRSGAITALAERKKYDSKKADSHSEKTRQRPLMPAGA